MVEEGVDSDDSACSEATFNTKGFDEEQDALDRKEPPKAPKELPRSAINSDGKYTVRGRGGRNVSAPRFE